MPSNSGSVLQRVRRLSLGKWLLAALLLRFLLLLVAAWVPAKGPHQERQVDTIGTALRYWNRFTTQPSGGWTQLMPAILDSGDHSGIMPMECPLMNLALIPGIAAGHAVTANAYGAVVGATLLLLIYLGLLVYANWRVWRGVTIAGVDAGLAVLLLPVCSVMLPYFGKAIPDIVATLVTLWGVGLYWPPKISVRRGFAAFALTTCGLLIKPTAVIAFAYFLLRPKALRSLWPRLLPVGVTLAITAAYYTLGNDYIGAIGASGTKFRIAFRDPVASALAYFSSPAELLSLLNYHLFFPFGLLVCVLAIAAQKPATWRALPWALMGVVVLQIIGIAVLDGTHSFQHMYYLAPAAFGASLLLLRICEWNHQEAHHTSGWRHAVARGLPFALVALWLVHLGEVAFMDIGTLASSSGLRHLFAECDELKKATPDWPWNQDAVFRSSPEHYPVLGLCFGERDASDSAGYGFFYATEPVPPTCQVASRTEHLVVARCAGGA